MNSGLNGTPIDLVRLGVLYLNHGSWKGAQLVPSQWVAETTDYATASPSMMYPDLFYTMGWWTRDVDGVRVFYTWGDHGQYVMVVPSLEWWWRGSDASTASVPCGATLAEGPWAT